MTKPISGIKARQLTIFLLGWPFSAAVVLLIAAMLVTWLPHYLLWPWWPDLDAWATIAQGWERGIRPYRDVTLFNFPGQIETSYALGKLCGWGRTSPVYALDAALLLGLGTILWIWSRRRLGRGLPGLIAFAAVVSLYTNLDYSTVAQRDWQGPLLALIALLVIQTGRGWPSLVASGALLAIGFAIRPHVVLFLPAAGLAVFLREPGDWRRSAKRVLGWGFAFAGFVLLAFSPLIVQGLLGDLIRGVRKASYGSEYNQTSLASISQGVRKLIGLDNLRLLLPGRGSGWTWAEFSPRLAGLKTLLILGSVIFVTARSDTAFRRLRWPWVVVLLVTLLYEPLHPKRHLYLVLPMRLAAACSLAVLVHAVLQSRKTRPLRSALTLVVLLGIAVPGVPSYCSIDATLRAIDQWRRADEPSQVPLGALNFFRPIAPSFPGDERSPYLWDEYRQTLSYLRQNTTQETVVANALRGYPFPAINGPVGRVSPFPAESGLIWIWSVETAAEAAFVAALERSPVGSVVVWSPDEPAFDPRLRLEDLRKTIRRKFQLERRFGSIEIWRKTRLDGP